MVRAQYLLLAGAIGAEIIGTLALKASAGMGRLIPGIAVLVCYTTAFVLLSQVLRLGMPVGTAYAIWSSVGVVIIALAGHLVFSEALSMQALAGIGLIVGGVVLVELAH
jgi:small multidrug resistance pump